jgi:hypothetical protein
MVWFVPCSCLSVPVLEMLCGRDLCYGNYELNGEPDEERISDCGLAGAGDSNQVRNRAPALGQQGLRARPARIPAADHLQGGKGRGAGQRLPGSFLIRQRWSDKHAAASARARR